MLEIKLDNNQTIRLDRKNLLIIPAGCPLTTFTNEEFDIILVIAGIDRTIYLKLMKPTILIIEAGIRTNVIAEDTESKKSQVVFIAGLGNVVTGIEKQNRGNIYDMKNDKFDLGTIANFTQITIK